VKSSSSGGVMEAIDHSGHCVGCGEYRLASKILGNSSAGRRSFWLIACR
jgi:hypothetical protein